VIDGPVRAELEFSVGPTEGGEADPADLKPQRFSEVLGGDQPLTREEDRQGLASFLLRRERASQPVGRKPPTARQQSPDALVETARRRIRHDDLAAEKETVIESSGLLTASTPVFLCAPRS
jgi:hypothetical protein